MSGDEVITVAVVVSLVVVLARGAITPAAGVMSAAILLLLTGVITPEQAFAGFSSGAVITVAALFVVAGAVERTGALDRLVGRAVGPGRPRLLRLLVPVAACSAVMNNTPIVAATAPAVVSAARRAGVPASRFLMPLSYATILGGVVTTIGTSTNLVVAGLLEQRGLEPLRLLEMAPVGLPLAVAGVALLAWTAPRLLPDRVSPEQQVLQQPRRYALDLVVTRGGRLDGTTLARTPLLNLAGVHLAARQGMGGTLVPLAPDDVLRGGDVLSFAGDVGAVAAALDQNALTLSPEALLGRAAVRSRLVEAIVAGGSSLVGRAVDHAAFRNRHGSVVLAVHRAGEPLHAELATVALRAGDALLLLRDTASASTLQAGEDFSVVSAVAGGEPTGAAALRTPMVLLIAAGMIAVATAGVVDILRASLGAVLALLATRCMSVPQARRAVDLDVLVVIAGSFALGAAVESSGLAARAADAAVRAADLGGAGIGVLAVVLLTMALTEPLSNAAAASLMVPVAIEVANRLGGDPRIVAVGVAAAASASFLTPIGYQTNTMVYGLGGYRFGDYARLGAPLTACTALLVPAIVTIVGF